MQNDSAAKGKKTCKEDGCEKNARKRGWCQMHYKRWLKHGDPTTIGKKQPKAYPDPNPSGLCMCGCGQKTPIAKWTDLKRDQYAGKHMCYVRGHKWRQHEPKYVVEDRGYETPCWVWTGRISPRGYGILQVENDKTAGARRDKGALARRVYYEQRHGALPDGRRITSLCGVNACVNPEHMEPEKRGWDRFALLERIADLRPVLPHLSEEQCHAIIEQAGMVPALRKNFGKASVAAVLKDLRENQGRGIEEAIQSADEFEADDEIEDAILNGDSAEDVEEALNDSVDALPVPVTAEGLHATDEYISRYCNPDSEAVEYIERIDVARLWDAYVNDDPTTVDNILCGEGGDYSESVRSRFYSELAAAESLVIPEGWSFHSPPLAMQKRTAVEVRDKRRVGNWSGTGAGKTGSAILASRVIDARVTLIVAANATIERVWCKEIEAMYPDSVVYTHVPDEIYQNKPNYIVLNYEKFQVLSARTLIERLVALGIDFVVLDEIQRAKQRDNNASRRRKSLEALMCALSEQNADLCVLGMSATPVINNLVEAKKLLELVMGHSYDDLGTKATVSNALAMRRALMLNGFRYRPNYETQVETKSIPVVANHLRYELGAALNPSQVEQVLLPAKLEAVAPYVRKGTVIYTHYTTGIITPARDYFEAQDYSVGVFTGTEKTGLDAFMEGKADILLGSEPIGTGVDGLQTVCDRIVVLSLPWTSAARDQLEGRIVRPGGAFDEVFMFVPQVILDNDGETWSWDETRMRAINHKRALADCAVDGTVPTSLSLSQTELLRRSKEALEAWMTRLEKDGPFVVERAQLKVPLPPDLKEKVQVKLGDFSEINKRWSNSNSTTVYERLTEDPSEWYLYHTYYREARAEWEEIPAEYIASQLRARADLRVGDFGCGECILRDALPGHDVVGLDYVAVDESVTACDMAKTPLEDSSLGAAVFSLSLMGRNWPEYFAEAYRTLQPYGLLFVAESEKRWGQEGKLEKAVEEAGFSIMDSRQRGAFRYITAVRKRL